MSYDRDLVEAIHLLRSDVAGIRQDLQLIANAIEKQEKPARGHDTWKEDQASDKQKAFMVSKSIPFTEPISKGEASEKIDRYIEAQKKARARS